MKHWYSHAIFGLILTVLFITFFRNIPTYDMLVGSVALVLGSMMPDIDHPKSKIRQSLRILLFLVVLFFVLLLLNTETATNLLKGYTDIPILAAAIVSLFVAIFIVFLIDRFIPPHRGPVHRISAAIVYAVLCTIIAVFVNANIFVTAFAGLIGYLSHLVGDMF